MDYDAFLTLVSSVLAEQSMLNELGIVPIDYNQPADEPALIITWKRGYQRDSEWGTPETEKCEYNEPEPELLSLETFAEAVCPDIGFLTFRKMERLVKRLDVDERDGYGLTEFMSYKYISLKQLHDFMEARELLPDGPEIKP